MEKKKLHTISDEDAIEVAQILLKTPTSRMYDFTFDKIERVKYDPNWGSDAEESVNVYFNAKVKDDTYKKFCWKDNIIRIQLTEHDAFHDYPYFSANQKEETEKSWKYKFLSNHVEAVVYLQNKNYL